MTKLELCKLIISSIKDFIHSPDCLDAHRFPHHFVRKRLLSFIHVIMYLLFSIKNNMETNLSSLLASLDAGSFPHVTKQAVSKARQGIRPSLFREIFQISVDLFYKNISKRKLWHGIHVFAVDGTRLQLPNSSSNFDKFGEMFSLKNPAAGAWPSVPLFTMSWRIMSSMLLSGVTWLPSAPLQNSTWLNWKGSASVWILSFF